MGLHPGPNFVGEFGSEAQEKPLSSRVINLNVHQKYVRGEERLTISLTGETIAPQPS